MILYPAIELRAVQENALETALMEAKSFEEMGFERLYIIDRDAQFFGKPFNVAAVQAIVKNTKLPVWAGGGVRDITTIRALLQLGAEQVIIGPLFWQQEGKLVEAAQQFPRQLVALIDALTGYIAHDSMQQDRQRVLELALEFERQGVAGILYMEHEREGVMGTLDTEMIADMAFSLTIPLYVTGGINSMMDLRALKAEAYTGIAGVVLGRALVDGRIDPITALATLKSDEKNLS
jgi:phosphoribosylformimino-5-aminoimidazole carboxamide ribotide isomerase